MFDTIKKALVKAKEKLEDDGLGVLGAIGVLLGVVLVLGIAFGIIAGIMCFISLSEQRKFTLLLHAVFVGLDHLLERVSRTTFEFFP